MPWRCFYGNMNLMQVALRPALRLLVTRHNSGMAAVEHRQGQESEINVSLEDCPGDKISATNLALFLIEQLSTDKFLKQSPFIANV